jgi:transposase
MVRHKTNKLSVYERLTSGRMNRARRKELEQRLYSDNPGLDIVHPDAAGIDIGNESHFVALSPQRDEQPVREFGSWTADLYRMAGWLKSCGIKTVAMQSTGVYWFAVYDVLNEQGLKVFLVNARHTKNLPGRKTDVQESQWLLKLHTYGLLRNSFRPPEQIRELRTIWRLRDEKVKQASECIQHMQKALTSMNVHLANAISDISGVTGQAIIAAILAGERDPSKLAELRDRRVKASAEEIALSLEGRWQKDQIFALRQAVEAYKFCQDQMAACDIQLQQYLGMLPAPPARGEVIQVEEKQSGNGQQSAAGTQVSGQKRKKKPKRVSANAPKSFDLRSELTRICGVDLTRIPGVDVMTVTTIVAELGVDLKADFPNEDHLASWLKASPRKNITGGRVIGHVKEKSNNRVMVALRMAATSLLNSDSFLGAKYRHLRTRLGAPIAIKAMARILICHIYRMLVHGGEWIEFSRQEFERRKESNQLTSLQRSAAAHGMKLVPA